MFSSMTWDERYQAGKDALPWDTGEPAPELVGYFNSLQKLPERVLEIGCGTGTNAIWMAQKGCKVVATDVSPTAIDAAKNKLKEEGVGVDFQVSDIAENSPVPPASVNFVFDRGVYHVMAPEQRMLYIERVAEALDKGGFWLTLAGNADQMRAEDEEGPPQLKASELIDLAEKKFEIHSLTRGSFVLPNGKVHLAWQVLYQKRAV